MDRLKVLKEIEPCIQSVGDAKKPLGNGLPGAFVYFELRFIDGG